MKNRLFETENQDPAINLAMEEALLLGKNDAPALFLWQNAHTVVIGRGQNAWKECRTSLLADEGGTLVRRSTGGGAVYHDLGNLNFSFLMPKALYDVPRQLDVIRAAAGTFGIQTERSGRNDIVLKDSGAKFSGNAFRHTQTSSLHHGTILMDVDMAMLGRYLAPSQAKLAAKGVQSVRARVGNLKELAPSINIQGLKDTLFAAFEREYGQGEKGNLADAAGENTVRALTEKYRSWEWTYGATPRFDATLETRFPWGGVELLLSLSQGRVTQAQCFTDANDPELGERVAGLLLGSAFTPVSLAARLTDSNAPEDRDVGEWLASQPL